MDDKVDEWGPYDAPSVKRLEYLREKCDYIQKQNQHFRELLIECRTTISVLRAAARCHAEEERAEHDNIMFEVDVLLDNLRSFTRGKDFEKLLLGKVKR